MKKMILGLLFTCLFQIGFTQTTKEFIRINQLGYTTKGIKVAVWCSMNNSVINNFSLVDAATNTVVFKHAAGKAFGNYGPFTQTYRLKFSEFIKPGKYYIKAGNAVSKIFKIDDEVYKGTADFCLQYMRQQRSGFNPFLKDSCHTHDGYVLYGKKAGIKDSTYINVVGGWHDASDYLQYSTTTANATYHLLKAYKDFKEVFTDEKLANGLQGSNGMSDVLDEAKWGLDWLLKMHPADNMLFNQLGDDRDHRGMRIPKEDTYYGKGFERPVYLVTGELQQRGKFMNNTTGTSSTAAKFASAFTLGASLFKNIDASFSNLLFSKSSSALKYALIKPGVTQTVSVLSPYIYAEDNWVDDMELAYATNKNIDEAYKYAKQEPITPWLGTDTAKHYQWYPFINLGHYELAKQLKDKKRDTIIGFYKQGIEKVFVKAKQNAFYRGIPFIWCSNNLTVSFAIQCYWYKQLTNNNVFDELEQANIDWLFGCNPWGTSMVYGLPFWGDTPEDPHSAFTHLKNYPINGGLVDGPVYTSIYKSLIGIQLKDADEYADFQSNLAVYHDDYGDYSTNEPTMDGTAALIYMLAAKEHEENIYKKNNTIKYEQDNLKKVHGAIVRGDSLRKEIALVFTADEFGEGLPTIIKTLAQQNIKASFFFTGNFYRTTSFQPYIKELNKQQHYIGPHSDKHLLYCDWTKRDSLLINFTQFSNDYNNCLLTMESMNIDTRNVNYFIPPYEWWNDSIAIWCSWKNIKLFSFTSGTRSNADYTWPQLGKAYANNNTIMQSIKNATEKPNGLNGNILLLHAGTDPRRKEKFYTELNELITFLKQKGYSFKKVNELF
ncbi:MAG: glycoside hydrolase family 9 protein [Bacteroidetes bacterium]|nr:glycoside hydrolase family 9 protein [Bacteroidota bacterium]MBS1649995.1 glycoside hydrolase family 9 protein [Bacteroidota bacterium]